MKKLHGKSNTRLYKIWIGMRQRCYNTKKDSYKNYGAVGIKVCDAWNSDFSAFEAWSMENGYLDTLSIDRSDNAGDYCPDNCRWETPQVQGANTRILYAHNKSGYRGVSWNSSYAMWESSIQVDSHTIKVGYYNDKIQAAKAYDTYIKDNNLPHTVNNLLCIDERVDSNVGQALISTNTSGFVGVTSPKRIQHLNNPWYASISSKKKRVWGGYFSDPKEAAYFRDKYIRDNALSSKLNFSDEEFNKMENPYVTSSEV